MIHIFATLIEPIQTWIGKSAEGADQRSRNWKVGPRNYINCILNHWGFKADRVLSHTLIQDIIRSVGTIKDLRKENEAINTLICDIG